MEEKERENREIREAGSRKIKEFEMNCERISREVKNKSDKVLTLKYSTKTTYKVISSLRETLEAKECAEI